MTSVATTQPGPPATQSTRRLTLMQRIARDVLGRWGARLGLTWVALLVLGAVFAPFIANSYPLAAKMGGQWSFPLFRHLTQMDVVLLVAFAVAVVLWLIPRWKVAHKVAAMVAAMGVAVPICFALVQPPVTQVYEHYRELDAMGQVERAFYVPVRFSPEDRLHDQPNMRLTAPSTTHWMGVTANGADLFSNMVFATRIALSIGFISTGIAIVLGVIIGGFMGYFSGIVDLLGMRLVEIFSAIPTLLLLLCFVAFFDVNLYFMMVIIGLTSWVGYAIFVRAEFLRLRQQDFVQAAEALGLPLWSILFRHMLPNGVSPVLVSASFGVASAILAESTLSFLGIGLVAEASWGKLLNQALGTGGTFYWWIALYPGLAIFLTVFAYILIGEATRDAIDPHAQQSPL